MSHHYKTRKLTDKVKLPKAKGRSPGAIVTPLNDWFAAMTQKLNARMDITHADLDELGARIAHAEDQIVAYGDRRYHEGEQQQVLFPREEA